VRLHRLHRDEELTRDLSVGVPSRDQPEDLTLPGRQLLDLRIERSGRRRACERIQNEPREPRGEHGVTVMDPTDRVDELVGPDRLGHVPPGARPDHPDHVLRGVGHRQGEEPGRPARRAHTFDHRGATAIRHVDVEDDDVGRRSDDPLDGRIDRIGVADDRERASELAPHPGEEQAVIVDYEDADVPVAHAVDLGTLKRTSVPAPGVLVTSALPPTLSILPSIESAMPRRSAPTDARSNPAP
jgi:hypothetical protein